MKKMKLGQLLKNGLAFVVTSAVATDTGLLFLDRTGFFDVPNSWYVNAPLAVWSLAGVPVTIQLAERLARQVDARPGRITGFLEENSAVARAIPLGAKGQRSTIFAYDTRSIFGRDVPESGEVYRPAVWRVPIEDTEITVRESELRAFLDAAYKRPKYQFSRNYWTRRRRPPLWRAKYEAYMRLLVDSDLVEGRHPQGGASGRLLVFPREAVMYLKHQSDFKVT